MHYSEYQERMKKEIDELLKDESKKFTDNFDEMLEIRDRINDEFYEDLKEHIKRKREDNDGNR